MVREVLVELKNIGLVDMEENLGFFVGNLDIRMLTDAFQTRAMHDALAARLCCRHVNRRDIDGLKEIAEQIYLLWCSKDHEKAKEGLRLDRQMHARLVEIADNEALSRARRSYWTPIIVFDNPSIATCEDSHREHIAIIEAIEQNRPDDAEQLARKHVERGLRYIQERMSSESEKADIKWYV